MGGGEVEADRDTAGPQHEVYELIVPVLDGLALISIALYISVRLRV